MTLTISPCWRKRFLEFVGFFDVLHEPSAEGGKVNGSTGWASITGVVKDEQYLFGGVTL